MNVVLLPEQIVFEGLTVITKLAVKIGLTETTVWLAADAHPFTVAITLKVPAWVKLALVIIGF